MKSIGILVLAAVLPATNLLAAGLDHFRADEFDAEGWSHREIFDRESQSSFHAAGVSDASGKAYLALVCLAPGEYELRASMGSYIGTPRVDKPFALRVASRQHLMKPDIRGDFFRWPQPDVAAMLALLDGNSSADVEFTLWDQTVHKVRFSLTGFSDAVSGFRQACR